MVTAQTLDLRRKVQLCYQRGADEIEIQKLLNERYFHVSPTDEDKLAKLLSVTLERVVLGKFETSPPLCLAAFSRGQNLFQFETSIEYEDYARRRRFHRYLDALVSFVSTALDIATTDRQWRQCHCNMTDWVVYQCHLETPDEGNMLHHAAQTVYIILSHLLVKIDTKNLDKGAGRWPRKSSLVIAGDASQALSAAKQWLRYTEYPANIFSCLTSQMKILPSLHTSVLHGSEFLGIAVTHFVAAVRRVRSLDDFQMRPSQIEPTISLLYMQRIIAFHRTVLCMSGPHEYREPYTPFGLQMYEACEDLIGIISCKPDLQPYLKDSIELGAIMYDLIPPDEQPPYEHPFITYHRLRDILNPLSGMYGRLKFFLERRECMYPPCMETTETTGQALQQCSACKVMQYCSAKCQKSAWKHKSVGHKHVCGLLARFKQVMPPVKKGRQTTLSEDAAILEDRARAAGLCDNDAKRLIEMLNRLEDATEMRLG